MLIENTALSDAWKTHIIDGLPQSPRWWIKPTTAKTADLKFEPQPLYPGLDIYSPQSKIIKQLSTRLVVEWLKTLPGTYVFVHRFDTVTGPNTQITCIGKTLFWTGIQDKTTLNVLPTTVDDYGKWGLKVCSTALDGIALENYRLDFVMIAPNLAELRAKGLLSPIATALFTLKQRSRL